MVERPVHRGPRVRNHVARRNRDEHDEDRIGASGARLPRRWLQRSATEHRPNAVTSNAACVKREGTCCESKTGCLWSQTHGASGEIAQAQREQDKRHQPPAGLAHAPSDEQEETQRQRSRPADVSAPFEPAVGRDLKGGPRLARSPARAVFTLQCSVDSIVRGGGSGQSHPGISLGAERPKPTAAETRLATSGAGCGAPRPRRERNRPAGAAHRGSG